MSKIKGIYVSVGVYSMFFLSRQTSSFHFSTLMVEGSKEAGAVTAVKKSLLDLHLSPCESSTAREALGT